MSDDQFTDVLGTEEARREKMRSIELEPNTTNVIEKYLLNNPLKSILHKKVWAIKKEGEVMFNGTIVDVYPEKILLVKCGGVNLPIDFDHVISMEG